MKTIESPPPPETTPGLPPTPDWRGLLATVIMGALYVPLLLRVPLLGHDWMAGLTVGLYPPWILPILSPLKLLSPRLGAVIIQGFTLSSLTVLTYHYARHTFPEKRWSPLGAVALVLLSPLPWMICWAGQIEMMVLVGLMTLPFGIPLLFAKPHIGLLAVIGRRRDILIMVGVILISFLIWGLWPLETLDRAVNDSAGVDITLGWSDTHPVIGLIGLVLLLFTTRDPLRLMATGMLISPYVAPYHFYMLLPALGRTGGYKRLILWAISFMPLVAMGTYSLPVKLLTLGFAVLVWLLMAPTLKPREVIADPDIILNRLITTAREIWTWLRKHLSKRQEAESSD